MFSYFVRLVLGGITKLAMALLLVYSLLIYAPGGARWIFEVLSTNSEIPIYNWHEEWPASWEFDKPWPVSYLAWLFDPSETLGYDAASNEYTVKGIDFDLGVLRIQGSGVLTGDYNESILIDVGKPVAHFLGPGLDLLFGFISTLIAILMALVVAQRWRRPQPYRVSALPTSSTLVDWWQLHSRSPLDVALLNRY